jgi:hypothetical protein
MRFSPVRLSLLFAVGVMTAGAVTAATWHVSPAGSDTAEGVTAETAFSSIQHAVEKALPGDTVLIHSGTYFENVILKKGGTRSQPIRIMADQVGKNRVVLTGAAPSIRLGKEKWELVDSSLGLYRLPFAYRPTRVLASQVDLFPYPNLESLKVFRFTEDDYPGCRSGFAWEAASQSLYVRLRQDGAYGETDPNLATMAVSPRPAGGPYGNIITSPDSWNFALKFPGPAHVVIDGLTFETPGLTGVYSEAGDLTVRNSWFYGCRYGVTGREPGGATALVDRVTVEQCYYTQYPAYSDALDVVRQNEGAKSSNPRLAGRPLHWQRKGGLLPVSGGVGAGHSYETGLTRAMGRGWVIRRNHLYETFEGFNSGSISRSVGTEISQNRFERICDNAVETEEHARELYIHDNLLIDVFEPFSWQPRSGAPFPGPVWICNNVVWQASPLLAGGVFKLGASDRNWSGGRMGDIPPTLSESPGGFWVVNNTIFSPAGRALTLLNEPSRRYGGFFFLNNIFWVNGIATEKKPLAPDGSGLTMNGNVIAGRSDASAFFSRQAALLAGKDGVILPPGSLVAVEPSPTGLPALRTDQVLRAVRLDGLAGPAAARLAPRLAPGADLPEFLVGPQPRK